MAWEDISDLIRTRIEKVKKKQGFISLQQLDELIDSYFKSMKDAEAFEEEFEEADNELLKDWLFRIKLRLKSIIATTIDPDNVIDDKKEYNRWIKQRTPSIQWNYFDRYLKYLKDKGRPADVIKSMEQSTEAIIERLGDPYKQLHELQKGLVLGAVQSGKTANFNGVINRAIDAGYDLVIVFSGIMEDLRSQTQKRINHDVIGLGEIGEKINQPVGVGQVQQFGKSNIYQITSITSASEDFRKSRVDSNSDFINQRILVCKKNVGVLTNLIYWLKSSMSEGSNKLPQSLLVIDDEADNASLNNLGYKGAMYASKVNGHIRALLDLFKRRSYLGYTATPFANILQDQHGARDESNAWNIRFRYNGKEQLIECSLSPGLFPDKFIYKLATPSSYLGPKRFFSTGREQEGDKKIPLIETIPLDDMDQDHFFEENTSLPKSLTDAVDCFILSIALREARRNVLRTLPGYTDHHTMLVHISRFISEQTNIAQLIDKYVRYLTKRINDESITDPNGIYERLRLQWNRFFAFKVANIKSYLPSDYNTDGLEPKTWNEISELLPEAISNILVKAINSSTGHKLEYLDGTRRKYIAIGGDRLSRGFTLEGLTINYFLRDTNYYDTLLQMGRWFGYRPGYIDACRLFIDFSTEEKYNFITAALCELEEQIENMEIQKKSPKEFELRIRKHPDVLKITRPAILKNAVDVRFSFQDNVQQSTFFKIEKDTLRDSWNAFSNLYNELTFELTGEKEGFYMLEGDKDLLFRFLDLPGCYLPEPFMKNNLKSYINLCADDGKLTKWRIAIKRTGAGRKWKKNGMDLTLTKRSAPGKNDENQYYNQLKDELLFTASGKSMNIMTSGMDESVGLPKKDIDNAIAAFRKFKMEKFMENSNITEEQARIDAEKITVPGWIFRKVRPENEGLLLIYLMDLEIIFKEDDLNKMAKAKQIDTSIPMIGYALSFPQIKNDPGGIYLANEVLSIDDDIAEGINEDTEVPEDINTEVNDII